MHLLSTGPWHPWNKGCGLLTHIADHIGHIWAVWQHPLHSPPPFEAWKLHIKHAFYRRSSSQCHWTGETQRAPVQAGSQTNKLLTCPARSGCLSFGPGSDHWEVGRRPSPPRSAFCSAAGRWSAAGGDGRRTQAGEARMAACLSGGRGGQKRGVFTVLAGELRTSCVARSNVTKHAASLSLLLHSSQL